MAAPEGAGIVGRLLRWSSQGRWAQMVWSARSAQCSMASLGAAMAQTFVPHVELAASARPWMARTQMLRRAARAQKEEKSVQATSMNKSSKTWVSCLGWRPMPMRMLATRPMGSTQSQRQACTLATQISTPTRSAMALASC